MSISARMKLNGQAVSSSLLSCISAYVMQEDVLMPVMTAREHIQWSADMRLPKKDNQTTESDSNNIEHNEKKTTIILVLTRRLFLHPILVFMLLRQMPSLKSLVYYIVRMSQLVLVLLEMVAVQVQPVRIVIVVVDGVGLCLYRR